MAIILLSFEVSLVGEESNERFLALWILNFERAERVIVYRWEKGKEKESMISVEYGYAKGPEIPSIEKWKSTTKLHAVGDFQIVFLPSENSGNSVIPSVGLTKESKPLVDSFINWGKAISKKGARLIDMGRSSLKAPGKRGK